MGIFSPSSELSRPALFIKGAVNGMGLTLSLEGVAYEAAIEKNNMTLLLFSIMAALMLLGLFATLRVLKA